MRVAKTEHIYKTILSDPLWQQAQRDFTRNKKIKKITITKTEIEIQPNKLDIKA